MIKLFNAFLLTAAAGGAATLLWRHAAADGAAGRSEEPHLPAGALPEAASPTKSDAREVEARALSDAERVLLADELRAQL